MGQKVEIHDEDGGARRVDLQYQLKKPCRECPYTPQMKGWIGPHATALDFHHIACSDQAFPCHMHQEQSCAGNAMYMNAMIKRSRDPAKAKHQDFVKACGSEVIFSWDGSELVDFHGK